MTLSAFGAISIDKGDAILFLHLFGGNFGKQEVGFIVTEKLIKEKPELVQRIVRRQCRRDQHLHGATRQADRVRTKIFQAA